MPRKSKDLTNQRFGKLTAIRKVNTTGQARWECRCDCGNTKVVDGYNLTKGLTKSCGCLKIKGRIKDLTNQRFGKLIVIRKVSPIGSKNSKWLCQCDCGNTTEVQATSLSSNNTKSCGCMRKKDLTNQRFGKLVAIRKTNTKGDSRWLCQCDCGNTKEVSAHRLLEGGAKSCGCLKKSKTKDLTNQRFGKLVALKKVTTTSKTRWLCQCDCGNTKEALAEHLLSGNTRSCGCLKTKDLTNRRFGKLVALKRVNTTGYSKWLCQCDCGNKKEILAYRLLNGNTKSCGCINKLKTKDLTNQRFGKLIALKKVNTTGDSKWLCQCDCGNMKEVLANSLLCGRTKSCGCIRNIDLTNQRFGKLVAIEKVNTKGNSRWLCQCDCGNVKEIVASSLLSGQTKSCGCISMGRIRDLTNQRFTKLVAIKRINTTGRAKWLCQCDCGNQKDVYANSLLKGQTKSCGCMQKERIKDLTNQRFGRLVVLKRINIKGPSRWLCQCDCGNIKEVRASTLLMGTTKSCGCLPNHKERDLVNRRFGRLVALKKVNTFGQAKWECQCDCGTVKVIAETRLLKGVTKSCGCLKTKDLTNQRFGKLVALKKVNTIGQAKWLCQCDCGNTKEIFANPLLGGHTKSCGECYWDIPIGTRFGELIVLKKTTKKHKSGSYYYECQCDCGNIAYVTSSRLKNGKTKSCGCCRREMRSIIAKERFEKHKMDGTYPPLLTAKLSSRNTSGYKGVSYNKKNHRWVAFIGFKGKRYRLGSFKIKEEAIKARRRAEEEMFEPILEKYAELQRNNNK